MLETRNALEYAVARKHVIVRWAGVGAPAGTECFLDPSYTELPFELEDVEGFVCEDGSFEGSYLPELVDFNGNTIYAVWLRSDEAVWNRLYSDWASEV